MESFLTITKRKGYAMVIKIPILIYDSKIENRRQIRIFGRS